MALVILDQQIIEGIGKTITELQAQKIALHPEGTGPVDRE
jgi:hypothetical protein